MSIDISHPLVADPPWEPPEWRRIVLWRHRRLVDAGFPAALANDLATTRDVDLHALLDLVDRGCPPVLAARILAPLDVPGGRS